jgi:hypothetical protein
MSHGIKYVFEEFLKYHVTILLGDLNAKVERENIFGAVNWE